MQTLRKWRSGLIPGNYDAVNLAIAYYVVMECMYSSFSSIVPRIALLGIQFIFYLLLINALPVIIVSFNKKHIIAILLSSVLMIVSMMIAEDMEVFSQVINGLIRWCIPFFLLGMSIRNADDCIAKLRISAGCVLLLTYVSIFVTRSSSNVAAQYSQDVGYQNAFIFVIFLVGLIQGRKIDLIGIVLSIIAVLMGGARGPVLCIAVSFFIAWLVLKRFHSRDVLAVFAVTACIVILLACFYQDILDGLIAFFEKYGISTRVLYGLASKSIAEDSSRSTLRQFALDYAGNHIFYGTGIINDRKLIYDNLTINSYKTVYGYYCHNFFLENMMQFGLAPGILACAGWIAAFIKPILRKNTEAVRAMGVIWISAGFLPLMVSFSYVTYQFFYLLAGFALSYENIANYNENPLVSRNAFS